MLSSATAAHQSREVEGRQAPRRKTRNSIDTHKNRQERRSVGNRRTWKTVATTSGRHSWRTASALINSLLVDIVVNIVCIFPSHVQLERYTESGGEGKVLRYSCLFCSEVWRIVSSLGVVCHPTSALADDETDFFQHGGSKERKWWRLLNGSTPLWYARESPNQVFVKRGIWVMRRSVAGSDASARRESAVCT